MVRDDFFGLDVAWRRRSLREDGSVGGLPLARTLPGCRGGTTGILVLDGLGCGVVAVNLDCEERRPNNGNVGIGERRVAAEQRECGDWGAKGGGRTADRLVRFAREGRRPNAMLGRRALCHIVLHQAALRWAWAPRSASAGRDLCALPPRSNCSSLGAHDGPVFCCDRRPAVASGCQQGAAVDDSARCF